MLPVPLVAAAVLATTSCEPHALREELLARKSADQAARTALLASPADHERVQAALAVDADNTAWMRQMLAACDWPAASAVGDDGAGAAWLLIQHADMAPDVQVEAAARMHRAVVAGEADATRLALLVDRHRRLQSLPQVYGMQFSATSQGARFIPVEAPAALDARRAEIGLPPFRCHATRVARDTGLPVIWPDPAIAREGPCPASTIAAP